MGLAFMEDKILELLGRYSIEAGLMGLCGFIAYKLGTSFIDKHFKHIERMTKDHDLRIDKLCSEHRVERSHWNIKFNETTEKFSKAVDSLKEQFQEIAHWRNDIHTLYQESQAKLGRRVK